MAEVAWGTDYTNADDLFGPDAFRPFFRAISERLLALGGYSIATPDEILVGAEVFSLGGPYWTYGNGPSGLGVTTECTIIEAGAQAGQYRCYANDYPDEVATVSVGLGGTTFAPGEMAYAPFSYNSGASPTGTFGPLYKANQTASAFGGRRFGWTAIQQWCIYAMNHFVPRGVAFHGMTLAQLQAACSEAYYYRYIYGPGSVWGGGMMPPPGGEYDPQPWPGTVYNTFDGRSYYVPLLLEYFSLNHWPQPSGFTRKVEQVVTRLSCGAPDARLGEANRARFVWRAGAIPKDNAGDPWNFPAGMTQEQRLLPASLPEEKQYTGLFVEWNGSAWAVSDDQQAPATVLTFSGQMHAGDLFGEWILNDIKKAINQLTKVRRYFDWIAPWDFVYDENGYPTIDPETEEYVRVGPMNGASWWSADESHHEFYAGDDSNGRGAPADGFGKVSYWGYGRTELAYAFNGTFTLRSKLPRTIQFFVGKEDYGSEFGAYIFNANGQNLIQGALSNWSSGTGNPVVTSTSTMGDLSRPALAAEPPHVQHNTGYWFTGAASEFDGGCAVLDYEGSFQYVG